MNKFILGSLFILFLYQTNCNGVEVVNPCNPIDYNTIVNQVTTEVEEKLSKSHHIEALAGNDKIATWVDKPMLEFQIVGPLTKGELRVLLIEAAEEFLTAINSNAKLPPFLKKFPFTAKEIDIGIRVVDRKGQLVFDPDIFSASVHLGKLYFHTLDKNNEYQYKTTEVEDYEKALKVKNQSK